MLHFNIISRTIALTVTLSLLTAIGSSIAQASLIGNAGYATTGGGDGGDANYSLGFAFKPTVNIDVTALGYYNGVGTPGVLGGDHQVAIYYGENYDTHVAGEVTVSALVLTSDANQSTYTYSDLSGAPVRLFAGVTYRIAGSGNENGSTSSIDGWHVVPAALSDMSRITFNSLIQLVLPDPNPSELVGYYGDTGLGNVVYPTGQTSSFYAPANFLFVEAPEPASLSLFGLAALSLVARRRRN